VEGWAATPGTRQLHQEVSERGTARIKAKEWTNAELAARSELSKRLGRRPPDRWAKTGWTAVEDALLGTDHDDVIAQRIGRSLEAVPTRRVKRKIPAFSGWPGGGPGWAAEELALLGTANYEVIAAKIGRTVDAVMQKRLALRIAVFRDRRRGG
jgi:hypothetical protein